MPDRAHLQNLTPCARFQPIAIQTLIPFPIVLPCNACRRWEEENRESHTKKSDMQETRGTLVFIHSFLLLFSLDGFEVMSNVLNDSFRYGRNDSLISSACVTDADRN